MLVLAVLEKATWTLDMPLASTFDTY